MENQIKELQEELAKQKTLTNSQNLQIKELHALVSDKKKEAAPKVVALPRIPKANVKIGDKNYRWNIATFCLPGSAEILTAEEIHTDLELIETIIKIEGQGLLTELV